MNGINFHEPKPGDTVEVRTMHEHQLTAQALEVRPGDYGTYDVRISYETAVGTVHEWIPSRRWRLPREKADP